MKKSVLLVIFLNLITFGFYAPYWFLQQRKVFNQLETKNMLDVVLPTIALFLLLFSLLITIMLPDLHVSNERHLEYITGVIHLVYAIIILTLSFITRRILLDHATHTGKSDFSVSWLATFCFTFFYLQYKINRFDLP